MNRVLGVAVVRVAAGKATAGLGNMQATISFSDCVVKAQPYFLSSRRDNKSCANCWHWLF